MKAVFYVVTVDDAPEGELACATLAEARKLRAGLEYPDGETCRITTVALPLRVLLAKVFNRTGFVAERREVYPPLRRGRG